MNHIRKMFEATIADLLGKNQICAQFPLVVAIETLNRGFKPRYFLGWNGSPTCMKSGKCDTIPILSDKKEQLCYPAHAEVRAIAKAAREGFKLDGSTIYMSAWFPCAACAESIIEAGISRIITPDKIYSDEDFVLVPELRDSGLYRFEMAEKLLKDAKISIITVPEIRPVIKRK